MLFSFAENVPTRRSDRSTKGQGGALRQMQASSAAVQSTNGVRKKKSQAQNIPDNTLANPMAPAPKTYSKRKANVCFTSFFGITSLLMTPT